MICSNVKFRFAISTLVVFLIAIVAPTAANQTVHGAIVQDNPFGGVRSVDLSTTATSESEEAEKVFQLTADNERSSIGLVVRSVRRQDPQTPAELTQALSSLIDVEAWVDAKVYLEKLSKVAMNDKELFDLYTQRGAEFFYILHSVEQLAPESQRLAKRVLGTAKSYATSESRIQTLVKTLADPDINVRSAAFQKLKQIGPAGYVAMLEIFGHTKQTDLWPACVGPYDDWETMRRRYLSPGQPVAIDRSKSSPITVWLICKPMKRSI
jgi:hypothetical protein